MLDRLNSRPWCYQKNCPVDWAKGFIPLIKESADDEDYEAAKATKDAIIEFLNGFGAKLPADCEILLPKQSKHLF